MHQKKKNKKQTNKQLLINNIIYELELSERKSDRHKNKGGKREWRVHMGDSIRKRQFMNFVH